MPDTRTKIHQFVDCPMYSRLQSVLIRSVLFLRRTQKTGVVLVYTKNVFKSRRKRSGGFRHVKRSLCSLAPTSSLVLRISMASFSKCHACDLSPRARNAGIGRCRIHCRRGCWVCLRGAWVSNVGKGISSMKDSTIVVATYP